MKRLCETTGETTSETVVEETKEKNAIGLYIKDREKGTYELSPECSGPWLTGKDIIVLEAFASDEAVISGDTYGNLWLPRWDDHPDAQISKIGYKIQIELEDGEIIEQQILRPSDTVGDYNDYVEIWIYDDIYNLNASWYSHLTEDDFTQDSLCTSIKLTAGESISQVTAIDLSVFIYTGDVDFSDEDDNYSGDNFYVTRITKAE
jgi:hypothetical protein